VLYRSRMNSFLGRNFEAMDPLEWLARMADHIPDPGKHRTHFYAYYANRTRGRGANQTAAPDLAPEKTEAEKPRRRCSPSWARLLSKVYQVDPLQCRKCGGPLRIMAYVTNGLSIRKILDYLGLSPPEEKPPPEVAEVVRVPVDDEGREIGITA
jgi:hypothetical protein